MQFYDLCYNKHVKTLKESDKKSIWDQKLLKLDAPHILQSWTWGEFKTHHGWQATRLLWCEEEHVKAAAHILVQNRGMLRVGYIPKGPILDWCNHELVREVLSDLERFARKSGLLLLKIDPDVREDKPYGQAVLEMLSQCRWRPSSEQIQFRNTAILNLQPELDDIMANMKSKWRYNIRLAVRRGVKVRVVDQEELPSLYRLYLKTAQRDNFIIRTEDYYLDVWQRFQRAGLAIPLLAEVKNEPVAMLILFHFGNCAWYMYGASSNTHRRCMPNHLLQWEAIRRAKALGCTTYDLWGAPDTLDEKDPMWGVYRFKQGFGSEFVPHIGAYDFAPNGLLYRAYTYLRPHLVRLAQRRYWSQVDKSKSAS